MTTAPYSTACGVAITNNYDTVGSLTRDSIAVLTTAQVKALFTDGSKWNEMTAMLQSQFEMRMCGIRRYGMYDWIMSSNRPGLSALIDSRKQHKGPSLVHPFIMGRQMSVVNAEYWAITCGAPASGYTHNATPACTTGTSMAGPLADATVTAGITAGASRVIRVISSYGVTLDAKYFLPGHFIYHLNRSSGGVAQHGQWKIYAAAAASDLTFIDVQIQGLNSIDTTTVDATPLDGMIIMGPNNVHDVETYCKNMLNVNPVKYVPFWYQTYRTGRRVDSTYEELFKKLLSDNQWFAQFQDLPIAERNRQDEMNRQRQFVNAFFFGRAISSNQTLDGWGSLEQIKSLTGATVDPGTGNQVIAYRANMIGVYDQLKSCTRVKDYQNQPLDIKTFCETYIYDIWRSRNGAGRPADTISIWTDSDSAGEFQTAFIAYVKSVFGDIVRLNVEEGSDREFGFQWKTFKLPKKPFGVSVQVITHEYFDDMLNTFGVVDTVNFPTIINQSSRGRFLAVLDLGKGGSIYPAVLGSNRKTFVTGELEKLAAVDTTFACVMENPTVKTSLTSETVTAIVECPLHSRWDENYSVIELSS